MSSSHRTRSSRSRSPSRTDTAAKLSNTKDPQSSTQRSRSRSPPPVIKPSKPSSYLMIRYDAAAFREGFGAKPDCKRFEKVKHEDDVYMWLVQNKCHFDLEAVLESDVASFKKKLYKMLPPRNDGQKWSRKLLLKENQSWLTPPVANFLWNHMNNPSSGFQDDTEDDKHEYGIVVEVDSIPCISFS
jgi:hypothetical protein